jgi:hypothetical protein
MTTRSSARVIVSTSLASAWPSGCRRLLTDVRTGLLDVLGGRLHYQDFWRSLRSVLSQRQTRFLISSTRKDNLYPGCLQRSGHSFHVAVLLVTPAIPNNAASTLDLLPQPRL